MGESQAESKYDTAMLDQIPEQESHYYPTVSNNEVSQKPQRQGMSLSQVNESQKTGEFAQTKEDNAQNFDP